MTLSELYKATAGKENDLSQESVKTIIGLFFNTLKENMTKESDRIIVPNFGTFSVKHSKARQGRNPGTGEVIDIKAKDKLAFKPSKNIGE